MDKPQKNPLGYVAATAWGQTYMCLRLQACITVANLLTVSQGPDHCR